MRVEARSRRARRKRIVALRRRLIVAAAALSAFSTVFHSGWTMSVHNGDGRMILLLAALGVFLALRYRERRVSLMLVGEAVFGALVALMAVVHFGWGERGPGLALLLLAGPVWLAAAALPDRGLRWIEEALTGEAASDEQRGAGSSKRCPDCYERIRFGARICRFCGFRLDASFEWVEALPLQASRRSRPRSRRELAQAERSLVATTGWGVRSRASDEGSRTRSTRA